MSEAIRGRIRGNNKEDRVSRPKCDFCGREHEHGDELDVKVITKLSTNPDSGGVMFAIGLFCKDTECYRKYMESKERRGEVEE